MIGDSSRGEAACYRPAAVDSEDDRTQIDPRANPWAMLAALPLFSGLPKSIVDAAVTELEWMSLPGGGLLFEAGSPADAVYFVVSGCLGVYGPGGELIGRIAAGETRRRDGPDRLAPATRRPCGRCATRNWRCCRQATFERVLLGHPEAILRLARLTVTRHRRTARRSAERQMTPRTLALIPLDDGIDLAATRRPARRRAGALRPRRPRRPASARAATARNGSTSANRRNDFVVYAGDPGDTPWTRLCLRQADVVLLAARAPASDRRLDRRTTGRTAAMRRAELLILHEGAFAHGAAARWHGALCPASPTTTCAATRRLRAHRAPADRAARSASCCRAAARAASRISASCARCASTACRSTSSAAPAWARILAAGVAADWADAELVQRFKRCFVDTNPLSDFTLPLVSLVSGRKVGMLLRQRARRHRHRGPAAAVLLRVVEPHDRPHRRAPAGTAVAVAARLGRDPGRAAAGVPGRRGLRRRRRDEQPAGGRDAREGPRPRDRRRLSAPTAHSRPTSRRPRRRRSGTLLRGRGGAPAPEHPADPLARRHGQQHDRDARAPLAERPAHHARRSSRSTCSTGRDSSAPSRSATATPASASRPARSSNSRRSTPPARYPEPHGGTGGWQFWIDRGGTFTDIIGRAPDGRLHRRQAPVGKRRRDRSRASPASSRCSSAKAAPEARIESIRIGTTVATNALLERRGVPTALVTTAGFGDALAIGYQNRPRLFDLRIELPAPLYARGRRGRRARDARGRGAPAARRGAARRGPRAPSRARGIESVAIVFMHGYRHAAHESRAAALARAAGFREVIASHEVVAADPAREPRRHDGRGRLPHAAARPLRARVPRRRSASATRGVRLEFMQSNGGLAAPERVSRLQRRAVGPGRRPGRDGADRRRRPAGRRLIAFDMGGTSTDVALYDGALPQRFETAGRGRPAAGADDEHPHGRRRRRLDARVCRRATARSGPGSAGSHARSGLLSQRRPAHRHRRAGAARPHPPGRVPGDLRRARRPAARRRRSCGGRSRRSPRSMGARRRTASSGSPRDSSTSRSNRWRARSATSRSARATTRPSSRCCATAARRRSTPAASPTRSASARS